MKLNDIELLTYNPSGANVTFLLDCDFKTAGKLDGKTLTVTSGGQDVAVFGGYHLTALELSGDNTRATFAKTLEADTAQAIQALEANQAILRASINTTDANVDTVQTLAEANAAAIEELIPMVLGD